MQTKKTPSETTSSWSLPCTSKHRYTCLPLINIWSQSPPPLQHKIYTLTHLFPFPLNILAYLFLSSVNDNTWKTGRLPCIIHIGLFVFPSLNPQIYSISHTFLADFCVTLEQLKMCVLWHWGTHCITITEKNFEFLVDNPGMEFNVCSTILEPVKQTDDSRLYSRNGILSHESERLTDSGATLTHHQYSSQLFSTACSTRVSSSRLTVLLIRKVIQNKEKNVQT